MKHLFFIFLSITLVTAFFGCSYENDGEPVCITIDWLGVYTIQGDEKDCAIDENNLIQYAETIIITEKEDGIITINGNDFVIDETNCMAYFEELNVHLSENTLVYNYSDTCIAEYKK